MANVVFSILNLTAKELLWKTRLLSICSWYYLTKVKEAIKKNRIILCEKAWKSFYNCDYLFVHTVGNAWKTILHLCKTGCHPVSSRESSRNISFGEYKLNLLTINFLCAWLRIKRTIYVAKLVLNLLHSQVKFD